MGSKTSAKTDFVVGGGGWWGSTDYLEEARRGFGLGASKYHPDIVGPLLSGLASTGERLGALGETGITNKFGASQDAAIMSLLGGGVKMDFSSKGLGELFDKGVAQPMISSWKKDISRWESVQQWGCEHANRGCLEAC